MAPKKQTSVAPTGKTTAAGTRAPAGTIDVYSLGEDGTKTYLGWATDKNKLAFFSRAADRVLNPGNYNKHGNASRGGKTQQNTHVPKTNELLLVPNVDKTAAEILIKWINDNDMKNPKKFTLDYSLFGPEDIPFATAVNVHRAGHAFDLFPEPRGQVLRNSIFDYIHNSSESHRPSADDFKQCMEKIDFDGLIASTMMSAIMKRCVEKTLKQDVIDEVKQFCRDTGRYESKKAMGETIVAKKKEKYKGKKVIESGW